MIKNSIAILLLILFGYNAAAQEVMTSPAFNPVIAKQYQEQKNSKSGSTALKLPFYDDFSVPAVYPSSALWKDNFAFINTDFAKFPPSIGVATLDVLNEKGALYPEAGPYPFDADYLTSQPIRLDSIFSPSKKVISRKD